MKIKKLTAMMAALPFSAATVLTAAGSAPYYSNASTYGTAAINPYPKMSYPRDRTSKDSRPDRTYSPPSTSTSTGWFGGSKGKASHQKRTSNAQGGSLAQPGKVLSKEDRQKRASSATIPEPEKSLKEQRAEDLSFRALYSRLLLLVPWKVLQAVNASFKDNLAPEAPATTVHEMQSGIPSSPARHLIIFVISFLTVFGLGWNAITYLIAITSVSAQCTASTVYSTITVPVPVTYTYTYTESIFVSPTACTTTSADVAAAAATTSDSLTTSIPTSTSTSTSFSTTTVTLLSATPSELSVSTSSTLPFVFSVNSGTTSWINGVSPSSGALLTTATTTIFVTPSDASDPTHTSQTTTQTTHTHTTTITPAAETSTLTTFMSPDLTLTTHITRTSTLRSLTTVTVPPFGGPGGWNRTSSQDPSDSVYTAAIEAVPTTATISFFWASSGGHTYSTSTKIITTTFLSLQPIDVPGSMSTAPATSKSAASRNSTAPLTSAPNSTLTDVGTSSPFATMSPGTDGISPASGGAAASSGSDYMSPESATRPAIGITGPTTGATSTSSGNIFTPNATSVNAGISPESATGGNSKADPSESYATQSAMGSSAGSSQNGSSIVSSNSAASSLSLDATTTEPSGTSASVAGATGISPASMPSRSTPGSNTSTGVASGDSSTPTLSATAILSGGSLTASSSSTVFANASLTSAVPSTQALTSIGSTLTNGPAMPTLSSLSSVKPSSQTISSIGSSPTSGQASSSSPAKSSTHDTHTKKSTSSSNSITIKSSKTSASASVSPTVCGEHGDFTLDFDDLPAFSGNEDITQAPPIFSPYHHLTFSNGYVHAPQNKQPFTPHSGDQLAVFLASGNGTNDTAWHQSGTTLNAPHTEPGEITDGPYDGLPAFWFNARGAWLGCDNDGPEACVLNVTGWTWNSKLSDEVATYNTRIELPPCPGFQNCQLQHVDFPESFHGLSGISIQAFANNKPRMFFMDDLALSWFDNSCEAGMRRMARPGSFGGPGRSGGGGKKRVVRRSLMR